MAPLYGHPDHDKHAADFDPTPSAGIPAAFDELERAINRLDAITERLGLRLTGVLGPGRDSVPTAPAAATPNRSDLAALIDSHRGQVTRVADYLDDLTDRLDL